MSMSNTLVQERHSPSPANADAPPAAPGRAARGQTPIVPQATISARALIGVVAIMTFLASLTIGAVALVRAAALEWQSGVAREMTVQIRPAAGRDMEMDVAKATTIARAFPGVSDVKPYSREESTRLLEPWLGSGLQFEDLPIPRIVVVRIAPGAVPDISELRKSLAEQIPTASLDDHRGFVARMRAMSDAALLAGIAVLVLVLLATVLSVTFATRAAMATNRHVIEVLHLIGAKDSFIASRFQRHFLQLGFKGGLLGGSAAIALFVLADLAGNWFTGTAAGDQFAAMFGTVSIGVLGYAAILAQVCLVAMVTGATSHRTVNRTIETIQ
ncbi:MAG TPA: ABC transporter permease [Xanthobacteraceae bacterium]